MSLVNDMLRDLDQRREKAPTAAPVTASAPSNKGRKTTGKRPLLLLSAIAVVAGVAVWAWLNPPQTQPVTVAPRQATVAAPANPVTAAKPALQAAAESKSESAEPVAPTLPVLELPDLRLQVSAISWQRDGGRLQLLLDTSQAPEHQFQQIDERHLSLRLNNATLAASVPALPSQLVETFRIDTADDQLLLALTSREPAQFQVHELEQGQQHRLQVVMTLQQPLARVEPVTVVVAEPPAPGKVPARPSAASSDEGRIQSTATNNKPVPTTLTEEPRTTQVQNAAASNDEKIGPIPVAPLRKRIQATPAQLDDKARSSALELVRKGRINDAMDGLRQQLVGQPASPLSRELLATLLISEQRTDEAEALIDDGLSVQPQQLTLRKLKARLLIQQGQQAAAATLLANSAPAVSEDAEYHQLKAAAEQQAGDHQAASRSYHALLQFDATNPAWWVGLGISLEALKQTDSARQAYRNVLQIPRVPAALSGFARQRLQQLGG